MQNKKKKILSISLLVALLAVIVGGTYAYFTAKSDIKRNTFTVGNIDIELEEPGWNPQLRHELIPGDKITKDPTVTVKEGSVDSYIFMFLRNDFTNAVVTPDINEEKWDRINEIEDKYDVYVYTEGKKVPKVVNTKNPKSDQTLDFFKNVTVSSTGFTGASDGDGNEIIVTAYAHQAYTKTDDTDSSENVDLYEDIAKPAALEYFKELNTSQK